MLLLRNQCNVLPTARRATVHFGFEPFQVCSSSTRDAGAPETPVWTWSSLLMRTIPFARYCALWFSHTDLFYRFQLSLSLTAERRNEKKLLHRSTRSNRDPRDWDSMVSSFFPTPRACGRVLCVLASIYQQRLARRSVCVKMEDFAQFIGIPTETSHMTSIQDDTPDDVALYHIYTGQYPEYSDTSCGQSDASTRLLPSLNAVVARPVLTS